MIKREGIADHQEPRRLAFYALGFFRPKLRALLKAAGFSLSPFGFFGADAIAIWGRKPVSKRGFYFAKRKNLPLLSLEDAFIRSTLPGWQEAPQGLFLDMKGIYYDANAQNNLTELLSAPQSFDLEEVKALIARQIAMGLSKYNTTPRGNWPHKDYILIVDQVRDDASIRYGNATAEDFAEMLQRAREKFTGKPILIRGHPSGKGYFSQADAGDRVIYSTEPANPWDVIENAKTVFTVTSQMGFEAMLAGHKPHVFGQPFYAGWGLTHDKKPIQRPRNTSIEALYHAAMIKYPIWFDAAGSLADIHRAMDAMEVKLRARDIAGKALELKNMRAWKRPHMKRFFPHQGQGQILRWGERKHDNEWVVEDGFLRSRGLGAKLVPPLSLVLDKTGIYFDPTKPSDLEALIKARKNMSGLEKKRADHLRQKIIKAGISKYNLKAAAPPKLPKNREVILVPGQVEDDRSVMLGATGKVKNTEELLKAVRRDNPEAFIIYKPHPDVLAGLRKGVVKTDAADLLYGEAGIDALWPVVDHIATLTSLTGFEALLRDKKVSCYGMPFYAGWGLTQDDAASTGRRGKAKLEALIYAALIDYPLYYDPKTRSLTTAEIAVERLESGEVNHPLHLRIITKLQQWAYRLRDAFIGS